MALTHHSPIDLGGQAFRYARDWTRLLRPHQWLKSLLTVPIALAFVPSVGLPELASIAATIGLFFVVSSFVYVLNDMADIERDRRHPDKRHRPLASGRVGRPAGAFGMALLAAAMVPLALSLPWTVTAVVALYLAQNVAYSMGMKHVPIVEMITVATGFAFRAAAGFLAVELVPGTATVAFVFFASLLVIVCKRRAEFDAGDDPARHRPVLTRYSKPLLGNYVAIASVLALISAAVAVRRVANSHSLEGLAMLTTPFLVYGLFRFVQAAYVDGDTGNPTKLVAKDAGIRWAGLAWIVVASGWIVAHAGWL